MKSTLTLGDGYVGVSPYPDTLRKELSYYRNSMEYDQAKHKRVFKATKEDLYSESVGIGPDGNQALTLFTMPGFAKRVKDHLKAVGWECEVVDRRTPMPEPDYLKAFEGLRDYQYELVYNMLMSGGGVLSAATGCLAAGTPVRMFDGTIIPVEQIKPGDKLLAFDDKTGRLTSSTVCDMIRTEPNHKPKPMLEVEINGEKTCTTYDHPFFAGDGFYPLYQLAWGALEAGQRARLELLCEQYGTPIDHTAVWFKNSGSNDPCFRPDWVLQDHAGWAYREGPSDRGGELAGEPAWTSVHQPYRLQSYQQQGGEPGVVHAEVQCVVWGNPWQYQAVSAPAAGHPYGGGAQRDTQAVSGENGNGEGEAETRASCAGRDTVADTDRVPTRKETLAGVDTATRLRPSFTIKAAAPYYTIRTREAPYSYCIGRRNCYLTHNSGKSHMIKAICNAYSHERLMLRGTPTIVVAVPDKDITRKNYEDLKELLPDRRVGLVMSGSNIVSDDIQVITLDSLHKLSPADVGVVIVDEMHTASADSRSEKLLAFTRARFWGVSATPDGRYDGKDKVAEGIFGPVVARFTYQDGVKAGCLVPIKVLWLDAPEPQMGAEHFCKYAKRESRYDYGVHYNLGLNRMIGRIFRDIPPDMQALGMLQFTKHMEYVLRGCAQEHCSPIPVQGHAGTDPKAFPASTFMHVRAISPKERKELYGRVASGEYSKVISTHIYKQGVNFVNLRIVLNLGGGGSEIVAKQVPGRASRKIAGKDSAYIVEFRHPWDMKKIKTKAGYTREVPGPVLRDDMAREKIYSELGFEQVKLNNELELPWIHNSNTQTR